MRLSMESFFFRQQKVRISREKYIRRAGVFGALSYNLKIKALFVIFSLFVNYPGNLVIWLGKSDNRWKMSKKMSPKSDCTEKIRCKMAKMVKLACFVPKNHHYLTAWFNPFLVLCHSGTGWPFFVLEVFAPFLPNIWPELYFFIYLLKS